MFTIIVTSGEKPSEPGASPRRAAACFGARFARSSSSEGYCPDSCPDGALLPAGRVRARSNRPCGPESDLPSSRPTEGVHQSGGKDVNPRAREVHTYNVAPAFGAGGYTRVAPARP